MALILFGVFILLLIIGVPVAFSICSAAAVTMFAGYGDGKMMMVVQRMFQSDLQAMISRYDILRRAEIYRENMAIVAMDEECDRVTAAKASDELLTIKGVQASFVLYPKGDGVYISARSLGEVNVQVIVEELGGGGNSTTAGGMLDYTDAAQAKEALLAAIDEYFEN